MKLSTHNPEIMKQPIVPASYFSAYPLKALNLPEPEKKSYLHIITPAGGKEKTKMKYSEKKHVFPMRNVYDEKGRVENLHQSPHQTQQDNMEEKDSEWFASYE